MFCYKTFFRPLLMQIINLEANERWCVKHHIISFVLNQLSGRTIYVFGFQGNFLKSCFL